MGGADIVAQFNLIKHLGMNNDDIPAAADFLDEMMAMINRNNSEIAEKTARAMQLVSTTKELKPAPPSIRDDVDAYTIDSNDNAHTSEVGKADHIERPEKVQKPRQKRLTAEETKYQKRIQSLAEQLATGEHGENAGAGDIVTKLGEEAELAYLRARVDTLTKMINEVSADAANAAKREKEAKEELAVLRAERDRLHKTVKEMSTASDKLKTQLDSAKNRLQDEQAAKAALQDEVDKAERAVRAGRTAAGSKDKDLVRALETIEKYKLQIKESLDRETSLREELETLKNTQGSESKKAAREKEELLLIAKKQQQLIDVLQRQKLHLQGALHLGLTEAQFNKLLEVQ